MITLLKSFVIKTLKSKTGAYVASFFTPWKLVIYLSILVATYIFSLKVEISNKEKDLIASATREFDLQRTLQLTKLANDKNVTNVKELRDRLHTLTNSLVENKSKNEEAVKDIIRITSSTKNKINELNNTIQELEQNATPYNNKITIQDCYNVPLPDHIIELFIKAKTRDSGSN